MKNKSNNKKVVINASFEELVKQSVEGNPASKPIDKLPAKKNKEQTTPKSKFTFQEKLEASFKLAKLVKDANESANTKKKAGG